jgi:hypothetical protein
MKSQKESNEGLLNFTLLVREQIRLNKKQNESQEDTNFVKF